MAQILIIDDDKSISYTITRMATEMGHTPMSAFTLKNGLDLAVSKTFDIVFLDVQLPDGNGLSIIPQLQSVNCPPEIIIITTFGNVEGAEIALKSGAWDYIEKPFKKNKMKFHIHQALQYRKQKIVSNTPVIVKREGIIGTSPQISECIQQVAQAAQSQVNVLLTGETGTGKELFANVLHANSQFCDNHFIVVDCASLPDNLVESILFGHVKGAFTGADKNKDGLIEQADGGTLFLDEIGELPLSLQKTFLRVLQEHKVRPVGSRNEIKSNFRLIAATNRDLEQMVKEARFRRDLLYRIRGLSIELPPLRNRNKDIMELTLNSMATLCQRYSIGLKGFSPECLDILENHDWPGNVRELLNTLESAMTAAYHEPVIFPNHLPMDLRIKMKSASIEGKTPPHVLVKTSEPISDDLPKLKNYIDMAKENYFKQLLEKSAGNMKKACKISGLSRTSLYDNIKKYRIADQK